MFHHHHSHSFSLLTVVNHSFMIISFVFSMMLIIEFLNYFTSGKWRTVFFKNKHSTYLICILLGIMPGCLGAFLVISLFSHGIIGIGALTAAFIATSGDESFIMISQIPKHYLHLNIILFFVALVFAYLTDLVLKHEAKPYCIIPTKNDCKLFFSKSFDKVKLIFLAFYLLVLVILSLSLCKHHIETYFVLASNILCFIILIFTHPHFIYEHIYKHLIKKHLIKLAFWTILAISIVQIIINNLHFHEFIENKQSFMLVIASLIGLIPESGPHIIFVEMFSKSLIPFSILLANSIAQDGHAGIPLFAESKKTFFKVKLINLIAALVVGFIFHIFF